MRAKLFHKPAPNEKSLLRLLFNLALDVFYDFNCVRRQQQAGRLKVSSKQVIALFRVYAIHIIVTITWSTLVIAAQIGWLLFGYLDARIGLCMNEKAPCFYLFIGRGITAMISFSASKTPRDKFNILSTHLTLVFYAVNMYLRTYKIESLAYTAKIGNATEYDDMLWYDRVYQFFISAMLVRAAVCHVSF